VGVLREEPRDGAHVLSAAEGAHLYGQHALMPHDLGHLRGQLPRRHRARAPQTRGRLDRDDGKRRAAKCARSRKRPEVGKGARAAAGIEAADRERAGHARLTR